MRGYARGQSPSGQCKHKAWSVSLTANTYGEHSQRALTAHTHSEHSQANTHQRTPTHSEYSQRALTGNTHCEHPARRKQCNISCTSPRWSLTRLLDPSCSSWSELQRSLHSSLPHVGVEAEASSVLCDAKGHLEAADFAKVGRGEA